MTGYGQKKRVRPLAPWKIKLANKLAKVIWASLLGVGLGLLILWTVKWGNP